MASPKRVVQIALSYVIVLRGVLPPTGGPHLLVMANVGLLPRLARPGATPVVYTVESGNAGVVPAVYATRKMAYSFRWQRSTSRCWQSRGVSFAPSVPSVHSL